ncbi:glycoside hydrolase family 76 protein [Silvibacterium sp.]|uniref:glycoside hydrolase family 76 protein n=1 Tax=Silvibacterium sp. TaxID=1964179 RepID=UPI0039E42BB9
MKLPRMFSTSRKLSLASRVALSLLLLVLVRPALVQWTSTDAQTAFSDYNNAFYFNPSGDNYDYRSMQGSTTTSGFWVGAEEIELAIDAYNQNPTAANQTIINQLCNGFVTQFSADWSGDTYDDDLMWATIAFTRAYSATGNSTWLTDAENNFATVWSRGYDTTYGGGIWWNVAAANTSSGYKASASNWTFVIAGNLLYQITKNSTYLQEADTVYSWAYTNLYNASTGEVYDGVGSTGVSTGQYSYNYGVSIGADYFENKLADANNAALYLINNLSSGAVGGYNIMPNYGQGGTDGGGFNGITLRWIGYVYNHGGFTSSSILPWAQTNVGLAWAQRNSAGLSWNDWLAATADTGLYSWDCSDTLVGMLDIPPPAAGSEFTLSVASSELDMAAGSSGSTTINVSPASGFTGAVSLAATVVGAPAGVSATLGENAIIGPGSTTLTVATTSTTAAGTYVVAVTGTSGTVSQTVYVRIGLPYFSLAITPASATVNQGESVTAKVTVTPHNGFNGAVTLASPTGIPQDLLSAIWPPTTRNASAVRLIATSNTATTASASLQISGTSGTLTATTPVFPLTVNAALDDCGTGVQVDLGSAYNATGLYPSGSVYSTSAGLDGIGYSYASDQLGQARVLDGTLFRFGPAKAPDVVYGNGQTIPLPSGQYTALQLLATGVNGEQSAQIIVVTYTDGSTSKFTQSFSDWYTSSNNASEAEAVTMPYRNYGDGSENTAPIKLYNYTFPLDTGKRVASITLPTNRNLVVLAATLTRQTFGDPVSLASQYNVAGIYTDGSTFSTTGGLDGGGTAYSANLLGDNAGASSIIVHGISYDLGAPNVANAIYGTGQTISLPTGHYTTLEVLGTGVDGSQTAQPVSITYTDGTTQHFSQSFSDWDVPKGFAREYIAQSMSYRDLAAGTTGSALFNLYHYAFPLDIRKAVKSITLPSNRDVLVLGMTLTRETEGELQSRCRAR